MKILISIIIMIVSISCFAKDYQLEMMFPRELKIKRSTLKIKCNDVVGYKYYHIRGRFISIPVVDNKGNMIKCK